MNIVPSWTVPMYHFDAWSEHPKYQSDLEQICYDLKRQNNQSGVAPRAKSLYESDFDFFNIDKPAVKALLEYVRNCTFEAAQQSNQGRWGAGARIGINMHESWCHITQRGGWHDAHTHPNSAWSGIYYIRAGDSDADLASGVNRFYCPWQSAYSDIGTRYSSQVSSIDIEPRDGELIIFPSWLLHSATVYQGDQDRIIVAFNCKFIDGNDTA